MFSGGILTRIMRMVVAVVIAALVIVVVVRPAQAGALDLDHLDQHVLTRMHEKRLPQHDTRAPYPEGLLEPDGRVPAIDTSSYSAAVESMFALLDDASLPSVYDSRDAGVISSVKDQGDEGCCWAFALCEAAQAGYLSNMTDAVPPQLDLSEWQLAYFMYDRPPDDLANTVDDVVSTPYTAGTAEFYSNGGNALFSMFGIANGIGFAYEDAADYGVMERLLAAEGVATLNDEACYPADSYLLENAFVVDPVEQPSVMKRMIMEHGAGTVHFNSTSASYDFDYDSYFNPEGSGSGHLVAVVGWDDAFPREHFAEDPGSDGAWLCKNSWGADWGGSNGYFWMSYEEPSIAETPSVFLEMADNDSFDHAYYYDGGISSSVLDGYEYSANVFAAKQDETVEALGFYTTQTSTTYEVSAYRNPSTGDPMSGEQVLAPVSGTVEVPGYHMLRLEEGERFDVDAGDTFAVVVRETSGGEPTPVYVDDSFDFDWVASVSSSKPGQSLASSDGGEWEDVSAADGNLRIKAFTNVRASGTVDDLAFEKAVYSIPSGDSFRLQVLAGGAAVNEAQRIAFSSSDSKVARVDGLGTVYARSKGTATITATLGELEAQARVTVTSPKVTAIEKPEGYATRENPLELRVSVNDTEMLRYTMVGGRGVYPTWSVKPLDFTIAENEFTPLEVEPDGRLKVRRAGTYRVTASYKNDDGAKVSQEFYVHATLETVECATAEQLGNVGEYGNLQTKVFMYAGAPNEDGYTFTFDDQCSLERYYDYLYVIASDDDLSAQAALDVAMYWDWGSGIRRQEFTGDTLAGLKLTVPCKHVAFVFVSDQLVTDYGFSVTSIEPRVPAQGLVFLGAGQDDEPRIEIALGEEIALPAYVPWPFGATDEIVPGYYDEGVASIADGMVTGVGVGSTRVELCADLGDGDVGPSLGAFEVVVTCDEEPRISFAEQGPLTVERGDSLALAIEDSPWAHAVAFESSSPAIATVDEESGLVRAYSAGTTTISACFDGEALDTIVVNVTAPDPMTVDDMRVEGYVAGMNERFTYTSPDPDAEMLVLVLDYWDLEECGKIRVYDGKGALVAGPFSDINYDPSPLQIAGSTCTIVLDNTDVVRKGVPEGTWFYGGFAVRDIVAGKPVVSMGKVADIDVEIPPLELGSTTIDIPIGVEPDGAAVHLDADSQPVGVKDDPGCELWFDEDDPCVLHACPSGYGTARIVVNDTFGHKVTFTVTVREPAPSFIAGVEVRNEQGGIVSDEIVLGVGEARTLPLAVMPSSSDERLMVTSGNVRVCSAYTYGTSGEQAIFLMARAEGLSKIRVKTEDSVWRTIAVRVVAAHEHSYASEGVPPTCVENGYTRHVCSACGDSYATDIVPAIGHDWSAWKTTKAPTAAAEGREQRVCSACGAVETRAMAKLPAKTISTHEVKWERIWGKTAPLTMQAIASRFGKTSVAVVTTDASYKDALAASSLAGRHNGLVLVTKKGSLTPQTKAALKKAGVKTVFLVGSKADVSVKVERALKSGTGVKTVTRVSGGSASAKAIAVAKKTGKRSDTVIIATQNGFQDALSIAPYSYATKSPILYAETGKKLSAATVSYIKSAKYRKAIVVGGPVALPASIDAQLKKAGCASITRLAGANAYATSVQIANWTTGKLKNGNHGTYKGKALAYVRFQPSTKMQPNKLAVSTGQNWLDALAGAALCGKNRSVLLLADAKTSKSNHTLAPAWCKTSKLKINNAYVFGGTSAVSPVVWRALVAATG